MRCHRPRNPAIRSPDRAHSEIRGSPGALAKTRIVITAAAPIARQDAGTDVSM
jgi:hypothetical protein